MSIDNQTYKEYASILAYLHALSKTFTKVKQPPIKQLLQACNKALLYKHTKQTYALANRVKFMTIAQIEESIKIKKNIYYKLMLIESFFIPPKKQDNKNLAYKTKPLYCSVALFAKEPLCVNDILLVKIPKNHTKPQKISIQQYQKILPLQLHYQHSLHVVIQNNLTYAKTYYMKNKQVGNSIDNKTMQSHTKNAQIKHICVVTECKQIAVVRTLDNNTIIPVKATQKALKALPKMTLLVVNEYNEITAVLGNLLQGKHDKAIALYVCHYEPIAFSDKALDEAKNLARSFNGVKGVMLPSLRSKKPFDTTLRYDITHMPFCTIDPVGAKDHDDAIYYDSKESVLYVAIADVSNYVPLGSTLDKEAQYNAMSLYFPNQVFPMLPPTLSADACSLKPHKKRLALVWALRLHRRTANILQAQIFQAIICSQASLHYEQVAHFLENPNHTILAKQHKAIYAWLFAFSKLACILHKKRMQQGVELMLQDFHIALDRDDDIRHVSTQTKDKAHMLIEEAMLLANQASANYLHNTIQHGIYRNHAYPNKRDFKHLIHLLAKMDFHTTPFTLKRHYPTKQAVRIDESTKMLMFLHAIQKEATKKQQRHIVDFCIVRHFAKANYMAHSIGHFGLGFPLYTHFTSPIRRYSDLIVHRLITAHLQHNFKAMQFIMREAKKVLPHINKREKQFDSIESYYKRLKMLRYAQRILPFDDEALVTHRHKGMVYGYPLHRVGYCNVIIDDKDSMINTPMIIQIQVVGVDFNAMSLRAVFIPKTSYDTLE